MKTLALAAALIAVVLAACSPPVTHGTVVDRRHTDAHEYSELYEGCLLGRTCQAKG